MMVNCPECNTEISSLANPCPKCGFPDAGIRSKKYNDNLCLKIKEDPAKYMRHIVDWDSDTCLNSNKGILIHFHKPHYKELQSCEVINRYDGFGYFVYVKLKCKTCGAESWEGWYE